MIDLLVERIREVGSVDGIHVVTNSKFAGAFVIEHAGIDDDLLIVAGDNLFDYSLEAYVQWWRGKGVASAVALYEHPDLELVKQYGVVDIDADERVVSFVEKPPNPASNLAATACYLDNREHLPLISTYLAEGTSPDQPGRLVEWLYRRVPVYGYRFSGEWLDIGDKNQLLEADNRARELTGLQPRAEYVLD